MTGRQAVSVLVVDDHGGFRALARALLEAEGHPVVGEAASGTDGISAAQRLHPDVVLLDVHLPDLDGFEVARWLAAQPDPPVVVLVSSRERADFGRRVPDSGARAFISKVDLSAQRLHALVSGGA